jgi:hypothetical protein
VRWLIVAISLLPIVVAALGLVAGGGGSWKNTGELGLRSLTVLLPTLLLAGAVGDEQQGKTYSYLWSRPMPRTALLYGKLVAILPVMAAAMFLSMGIAFVLMAVGPRDVDPMWFVRSLLGGVAGLVCASAFAMGLGSLFPKHALITVLAWMLVIEQALPEVAAAQNLATLHHVRVLAGLPGDDPSGSVLGSLVALAILTAIWLRVAVWRVKRIELSGEG